MDPVTILIFNSLVKRESVYLPQVGLLHVVTNPAMHSSNGSVVPPDNDVQLAEEGDGTSIVDLIMSASRKEREAAERIYYRWIKEVNDNGIIRIESVGTISDGRFMMDRGLRSALNPAATVKTNPKRPRGKINLAMTIALAVIAVAAITIGAITYFGRNDSYAEKFKTPAAATVRNNPSETAKNETAAQSAPKPGAATDASVGPKETAIPSAIATVPAATTLSVPIATPAASVGAGYYVVIGNFSIPENADRFIVECRRKDSSLQYNKLPLKNGKTMVYTSKWTTEAEARANRKLASYPDAWVYKYGG